MTHDADGFPDTVHNWCLGIVKTEPGLVSWAGEPHSCEFGDGFSMKYWDIPVRSGCMNSFSIPSECIIAEPNSVSFMEVGIVGDGEGMPRVLFGAINSYTPDVCHAQNVEGLPNPFMPCGDANGDGKIDQADCESLLFGFCEDNPETCNPGNPCEDNPDLCEPGNPCDENPGLCEVPCQDLTCIPECEGEACDCIEGGDCPDPCANDGCEVTNPCNEPGSPCEDVLACVDLTMAPSSAQTTECPIDNLCGNSDDSLSAGPEDCLEDILDEVCPDMNCITSPSGGSVTTGENYTMDSNPETDSAAANSTADNSGPESDADEDEPARAGSADQEEAEPVSNETEVGEGNEDGARQAATDDESPEDTSANREASDAT